MGIVSGLMLTYRDKHCPGQNLGRKLDNRDNPTYVNQDGWTVCISEKLYYNIQRNLHIRSIKATQGTKES